MPESPDRTGSPAGAAPAGLTAEDAKLVALARSARARTGAPEGAAVRDDTGRSYAAATVRLPALRLSALQAAVAAAVSSGAGRLEAACLVSAAEALPEPDAAVVGDLGLTVVVLAAPDGTVRPGPARPAG